MISPMIPKQSRTFFGSVAFVTVALWVAVIAGGNGIIIAIAALVTLTLGFMLFFQG